MTSAIILLALSGLGHGHGDMATGQCPTPPSKCPPVPGKCAPTPQVHCPTPPSKCPPVPGKCGGSPQVPDKSSMQH